MKNLVVGLFSRLFACGPTSYEQEEDTEFDEISYESKKEYMN